MFRSMRASLEVNRVVESKESMDRYNALYKELLSIYPQCTLIPVMKDKIKQIVATEESYIKKRQEVFRDSGMKACEEMLRESKEGLALNSSLNVRQKEIFSSYQQAFASYKQAVLDYEILKDLVRLDKGQQGESQQGQLNRVNVIYDAFQSLPLKSGMYTAEHENLLREAWGVFKSCEGNEDASLIAKLYSMKIKLNQARIKVEEKRFSIVDLNEMVMLGGSYDRIRTDKILSLLHEEEASKVQYIDELISNAVNIVRPKFDVAHEMVASNLLPQDSMVKYVQLPVKKEECVRKDLEDALDKLDNRRRSIEANKHSVDPMLSPSQLETYNGLIKKINEAKKRLLCGEDNSKEFNDAYDNLKKELQKDSEMQRYHFYKDSDSFVANYEGVESKYRAKWNEAHDFGFFKEHARSFQVVGYSRLARQQSQNEIDDEFTSDMARVIYHHEKQLKGMGKNVYSDKMQQQYCSMKKR